eukprot:2062684-Alexandrium_andersonii.AAC.1
MEPCHLLGDHHGRYSAKNAPVLACHTMPEHFFDECGTLGELVSTLSSHGGIVLFPINVQTWRVKDRPQRSAHLALT